MSANRKTPSSVTRASLPSGTESGYQDTHRLPLPVVEVVELATFGAAEYEQIVDGEEDPYGTDHLGMDWREKTGHVALVQEGHVLAHAGWVPADLRAATGEHLRIVGLGGVMVHRDHRGHGLGHRLVAAAMDRMGRLGLPVGMLFCRTQRVPFYESLGWHPTAGRVTADQPSGAVEMPLVTCWTPFLAGATVPSSALHIEGLPF
jgi:GNAT superfamily N-acetyltransferase